MSELIGYPQLQARFRAIEPGNIGKPLLGKVALAVVREQKLLAARFRKTGNLERGIVISSVTETTITIQARTSYSGYVESGTGLYGPLHRKITPQAKKVLAWRTGAVRLTGSSRTAGGKELAGWAFARSVRGRPATPFFFPGAKAGLEKSGAADGVFTIVEAWNSAA